MICNKQQAFAQRNTNHLYHVATQYMVPGMDPRACTQRDAMLKKYFEKVGMKNEYIIHEWTMQHYFSEDCRE